MLILGMIWVTSWLSGFSAIGERLLDAPKYLSNMLSGSNPISINSSAFPPTFLATAHPRSAIRAEAEQSLSSPRSWMNQIEGWFVASQSSSDDSTSNDPTSGAEESFQDFFKVLENAILGFPSRLASLNVPPVAIVEIGYDGNPLNSDGQALSSERIAPTCDTESPSEQTTLRGFQIWVKGCLIAQVPDHPSAETIANAFQDLLESPDLDASQLRSSQSKHGPVGQLGDRVLFTVNETLAQQLGRPAELIAIAWVNNLRIALGELPISVAEAQVQMHNLQDTGGSIDGMASWYGPYFHGRETATGEIFDQNELTAAHPTLPFDTYLKVTNLLNGKSVVVRVNDRGPYFDDRVLDLSNRAAQVINSEHRGVVPIQAQIMQPTAKTAAAPQPQVEKVSLVTGY